MNRDELDRLREEAEEIYEATMCGQAACCGDISGAIEYLIKKLTLPEPSHLFDSNCLCNSCQRVR